MSVKVIVRLVTSDKEAIAAIRKRFSLPDYNTINGWTPGEITEEDMPVFQETARRGFLSYRIVDWVSDGKTYSW